MLSMCIRKVRHKRCLRRNKKCGRACKNAWTDRKQEEKMRQNKAPLRGIFLVPPGTRVEMQISEGVGLLRAGRRKMQEFLRVRARCILGPPALCRPRRARGEDAEPHSKSALFSQKKANPAHASEADRGAGAPWRHAQMGGNAAKQIPLRGIFLVPPGTRGEMQTSGGVGRLRAGRERYKCGGTGGIGGVPREKCKTGW
jgi:hypothetical protein